MSLCLVIPKWKPYLSISHVTLFVCASITLSPEPLCTVHFVPEPDHSPCPYVYVTQIRKPNQQKITSQWPLHCDCELCPECPSLCRQHHRVHPALDERSSRLRLNSKLSNWIFGRTTYHPVSGWCVFYMSMNVDEPRTNFIMFVLYFAAFLARMCDRPDQL